MPHVTTCTEPGCGKLYEERSEEAANQPDRMCPACFRAAVMDSPLKRHYLAYERMKERQAGRKGKKS